jgi:queuine tRNA-ribosyltransferase
MPGISGPLHVPERVLSLAKACASVIGAETAKEVRTAVAAKATRVSFMGARLVRGAGEEKRRMPQARMTSPDPPPDPFVLGEYGVHTAREGFASIVHRASGEIMHSRTEPMEEAQRVYVEQAELAARLRSPGETLVLWDVGLGAAANAIAAIRCYEEQAALGPVRPMRIVSFENDIDSLRLALAHDEKFPYLQHPGPAAILQHGRWELEGQPGLRWELMRGDFVETMMRAPGPPQVIFYDMFSPKTCGEAWRFETFRRLFAACAGYPAVLCTYTLSTASRAAMLAAGFWVACGRAAGAKAETTIALTPSAVLEDRALLGAEWLAKWERSKAKFPADVPPGKHAEVERLIRGHPQFRRAES